MIKLVYEYKQQEKTIERVNWIGQINPQVYYMAKDKVVIVFYIWL